MAFRMENAQMIEDFVPIIYTILNNGFDATSSMYLYIPMKCSLLSILYSALKESIENRISQKVDHIERLLGRNGTDEHIRIPLRCFDLNVALAVDEHVAMYSNEIFGVECTTQ